MAKVSVIIPVYNIERYVNKAIESAINQTEKDIEIILVDDGSTDCSGEICDEYADKDNRIKVIHKSNGGLSSARNSGTRVASAEFVMYLDGDDYLRCDAVQRTLEVMQKYRSDFIQFEYQEIKDGEIPEEQTEQGEIYQAHTSKELFDNLYRLGGVAASAATKLIRKELMLEIPFVSVLHEDEMWCTEAFQRDLTATYITDKLYYYLMRENSIIHSEFNTKKLELFTVLESRIAVLKDLEFYELLSLTYEKLFLSIIGLYIEAKKTNDKKSLEDIQKEFNSFSKSIDEYADLNKKYKMLFSLMKIDFSFIRVYELYWKMKEKL